MHITAVDDELLPAAVALQRRVIEEIHGQDDLAFSEREVRAERRAAYSDSRWFAALDEPVVDHRRPVVMGAGWLQMASTSDTAEFQLWVAPEHRRRGAGRALLAAIAAAAKDHGHASVIGYTEHPGVAEPALLPPSGTGPIPANDPATRFMLATGFHLGLTERHSVLPTPLPPERLRALRAKAAEKTVGYRLIHWADRCPQEYLDQLAGLMTAMSTDIPAGSLRLALDPWDGARVRGDERRLADSGRQRLVTMAAHGEDIVAFTVLERPAHRPNIAFQQDTLVRADHRGHRLAQWVKVTNTARAIDHWHLDRIHTWNAAENDAMLAVNVALGYRRQSTEGCWQLDLSAGGRTDSVSDQAGRGQ